MTDDPAVKIQKPNRISEAGIRYKTGYPLFFLLPDISALQTAGAAEAVSRSFRFQYT